MSDQKPSPIVCLVASCFTRAGELLRAGGRPDRVMDQVSSELMEYAKTHYRGAIPFDVFKFGPDPSNTLHVKKVA